MDCSHQIWPHTVSVRSSNHTPKMTSLATSGRLQIDLFSTSSKCDYIVAIQLICEMSNVFESFFKIYVKSNFGCEKFQYTTQYLGEHVGSLSNQEAHNPKIGYCRSKTICVLCASICAKCGQFLTLHIIVLNQRRCTQWLNGAR